MPSFRWYKRRVKRAAVKAYGYAKKRYAPAGKIDVGRIAKDVSKIKGMLNTELKQETASLAIAATVPNVVNDTCLLYNLTQLSQNVTGTGRTGVSVRFKSVQLKGRFTGSSTWLTNNPFKALRYRVTIFIDKESFGQGSPTPSQLYYSGSVPVTLDEMRNWDYLQQKRFTVLYNRIFTLDNDTVQQEFKFYKKLNMLTRYMQGSNLPQNNVLYMMICADSANDVSVDMDYRVTFVDN